MWSSSGSTRTCEQRASRRAPCAANSFGPVDTVFSVQELRHDDSCVSGGKGNGAVRPAPRHPVLCAKLMQWPGHMRAVTIRGCVPGQSLPERRGRGQEAGSHPRGRTVRRRGGGVTQADPRLHSERQGDGVTPLRHPVPVPLLLYRRCGQGECQNPSQTAGVDQSNVRLCIACASFLLHVMDAELAFKVVFTVVVHN